MTKKERIETVLSGFTWNEKENSYTSLTAFESQIGLMNSFREQYNSKGDLSDRQIEVAEKIIEQNHSFSRTWRNSRC